VRYSLLKTASSRINSILLRSRGATKQEKSCKNDLGALAFKRLNDKWKALLV
jgi:hypothetical protein